MQLSNIEINNEEGLHARPAMVLSKESSKFVSSIWIEYNGERANAKSFLGLLALGVFKGARVNIIATGEDEKRALTQIGELIENNFKE
ncbi:HPr family phosphocarrier protein [Treponema sp. R6D11]